MNTKKIIKVSYQGETKRFKTINTYESLALKTRETFGAALEKVWPIKFYYLDDEHELISITSQPDYLEALEIEDVTTLKLTVADNAPQARQELEKMIGESMSLADSLNQSQQFNMPLMSARTMRLNSDVSEIRAEQSPMPNTARAEPTMFPEMGLMMKNMQNMFTGVMTDVKNLVTQQKEELEASQKFEAKVNRSEQKEECMEGVSLCKKCLGTQVNKKGKPCKKCAATGECASTGECLADHITCFKCKGTKVNPKGKPCGKCKQTGKFCLKDMGDVAGQVAEEIKALCDKKFMKVYKEHKKKNAQEVNVHPGIICDACEASPVTGIRYKCAQCPDYDLCAKCEEKGVHAEHTFLKIRKASQAPATFFCKFNTDGCAMQCPPKFIDQVVDVNQVQQMINNFVTKVAAPTEVAEPVVEQNLTMPTEAPESIKMSISQAFMNEEELGVSIELESPPVADEPEVNGDKTVDEEVKVPAMVPQIPIVAEVPVVVETVEPVLEKTLSPVELYKINAAEETQMMCDNLLALLNFGFENYETNKKLLIKFNQNLDQVANALMEENELYQ